MSVSISSSSSTRSEGSASQAACASADRRERFYGDTDDVIDRSPAMYDRLIDVFDKRDEKDWIGLLAFSGKWSELRDGVFERAKGRARACEDPDDEMRLSKLRRKLMALDERVDGYHALLEETRARRGRVGRFRGDETSGVYGGVFHVFTV